MCRVRAKSWCARIGRFVEFIAEWLELWMITGNITGTYERLGILNDTLFILTGDNGGIPWHGGNFPLRGTKATVFEGGVRMHLHQGLASTRVCGHCLSRDYAYHGLAADTGARHCRAIACR